MSASTVILNGLTTHDYGTYYPYFAIRNDSGGIVYASTTDPECTPDTEGVVSIANGDGYMAANTDNDNTCLYLSGTGKVTVIAQHDKIFPFKKAQGGGEDSEITPEKLGYVNGAQYFFDGIYNYPNKHASNALVWIDMANDNAMTRTVGNVYDDHYDKLSGSSSIFSIPAITYDNFTVEVVCTINSVSTSECDIASNFDNSGFGIYTENGILHAEIRDGNGYASATSSSFSTGVKYAMQIVYDGSVFTVYINGSVAGTCDVSLGNYIKSSRAFSLGGLVNGFYTDGAYNFYRFAVYNKALTASEIAQNYNADTARFDI